LKVDVDKCAVRPPQLPTFVQYIVKQCNVQIRLHASQAL
jgi:hypothetical protein